MTRVIAVGCLAVAVLVSLSSAARTSEDRYDFHIDGGTLESAMEAFVDVAGVQHFYPHDLAQTTGLNPVIGRYTIEQALAILLDGTGFSSGLTKSGVIVISLDQAKEQDREDHVAKGKIKTSLLASVSAFLLGTTSDGAKAQDSVDADTDEPTEVIIVTAQKRSQSLQDVPFSLSAIGGDDLETLGGEGFDTFARRIPGLQFTTSLSGRTQLSMRGISSGLDASDQPQVNTTVGLYLDETEISMSASNPDLQLFDLERVEVLRGPQGTLFGSGSMSGVIRLISRKPNTEDYELTLSSEVNSIRGGDIGYTFRGVGNVPLGDNAAFRILGYFDRVGGHFDNPILGLENTDDVATYGGRLSFLVNPNERSSILAKVVYQKREADDFDNWDALNPFPERGVFVLEPADNEIFIADLAIDYDFGFAALTSATAYRDRSDINRSEANGFAGFLGVPRLEVPGLPFPTFGSQQGFSQELRLASTSDGRLEWVVGGFFSTLDRLFTQALDYPGIEAGGFVPPGSVFGVQTDRVFDGRFEVDTVQYAAFVDATYFITDKLSVAAGFRYAEYEQDVDIDFRGIFAGSGQQLQESTSEGRFNPRFNVSYDFDVDRKAYFQAAQGFRLGGVNEPVPLPACEANLIALGFEDGRPGGFESDGLWNYEIGLKSQFHDRRITFNVAAFNIDYSDVQTQTRLDCAFSVIVNAGELTSRGVEVEFAADVTDWLSLGVNATYTDSTLSSSESALGEEGDRAPFVPKWAFNAFVDFTVPLPENWTFTAGADVQYVGVRQDVFPAADATFFPSYAIGNMRMGLDRGHLAVDFFVDNFWNERAIFFQTFWPFTTDPTLRTVTNRPRTIGLRATYRY